MARKLKEERLVIKFVCLFFVSFFLDSINLLAQSPPCAITSELSIVSQGTSNVILNVDGLIMEDLGSNQSICAVRLVFKHNQIENVRMTLVSPSGQRVTLVGPGRINANPSPLVNWNVTFIPCAIPPSPDPGINGIWDNGEPWAAFTNYSGIYHPFDNCLEDFNVGSANGSWLLEIENLGDVQGVLEFFQIIFCDPSGSNCEECFLFAGNFNFSTPGGIYTFCESDPASDNMNFQLDRDSIINGNQNYIFIYSKDDEIIKFDASPNEISDLEPGTYRLCGLAYQNTSEDFILNTTIFSNLETLIDNRQICAELTQDCITLSILEIENKLVIDTAFCKGDTIYFQGIPIFEDLDTTVIVSDISQNSCDSLIVFSARVIEIEATIASAALQLACGETLFLNGSGSSSTIYPITNFNWQTADGILENSVGPIAEISSGGQYFLEVKNKFCSAVDSISVLKIDTFQIVLDITPPICFQDSFHINITSLPANATYNFNDPSILSVNSNNYFSNEEGGYELESSLGHCVRIDSFYLIDQTTEITFEATSTLITCNNLNSDIVLVTNAENPTFTMTGPEAFQGASTTIEVSTTGIYTIEVTDTNGCKSQVDLEVISDVQQPVVGIDQIRITCQENIPGFLPIISSAFDSVLWNGPNAFTSTDLNAFPVDTGMYSLTVFGINGCMTSQDVLFEIINVPFPLEVSVAPIDCIQTIAEMCVRNGNIQSQNWVLNGEVVSTEVCFETNVPGSYFLEVLDMDGCQSGREVVVEDFREAIDAQIIISNTAITCSNSSVFLEALINNPSVNQSISWFIDGSFLTNLSAIEVTTPGTYQLSIEDSITRCTFRQDVQVDEELNPFDDFSFGLRQPKCFGELGVFDLISPDLAQNFDIFLNGALINDLRVLTTLVPDNYSLELLDQNGCVIDTSFTVDEGRKLDLELGPDIETILGAEIDLAAEINIPINEIAIFEWNISDSLSCIQCVNPTFTAYDNHQIILEVTDIIGCKSKDSLQIRIGSNVDYFVPNVFSPNEDGDNDYLTIYLTDGITKVFNFRIFDRWGNLVLFQPEILNENDILVWDGRFEGKVVEIGIYVYVAKLLLIDGEERLILGNITVLR